LKDLKTYNIDIVKLSNKRHSYNFEADASFFENFEQSLIQEGAFKVELTLDKSETMIQLYFHITGTVQLICDRTLEPFDYPIDINQKLILKYGEENEELTDEIEIIPRDTQQINVAQYIYEFIGLAIPMKKLHPKLANQQYQETDEEILVYSSGTSSPESDDSAGGAEDVADPRWEILKNLKKSDN
jgi:uncharacterized metal-binding protein YceD (DUF177 family)